ncbi:MAG: hypothetical protein AAFY74_12620 [Pseudomonadota bacterium]
MTYLFAFMLALLPVMAPADTMSASEFEAYTTGKTLFYGRGGESYGVEEYLENRRVRWSFLDGECKDGYWYESGPLICFVYEDRPDPQCWTFRLGARGLTAQFAGDDSSVDLYEAREKNDEMVCLGPKVGV